MSNPAMQCDRQMIERFVRHELSETEQSELETHLGECGTCAAALETAVANGSEWQLTQELLRDREFDVELMSGVAKSSNAQAFSLLSKSDDPAMLGRLGPYEVSGLIGTGGMGVVFKGFDRSLNRFVAIKVLAPHLATSASAKLRFAREAQAAAAVMHNNVLAIHAVSDEHDPPYFVMPYIRGESLQKRIDSEGALSLVETLRIAMQTAAGLAAAHAQGLVHRDIKPANILLAEGVERVRISDFGLARACDDVSITQSGVIAGTPQFMSPEQARGETVDARSDLFSLGSMIYTMCTGRPPFHAESSFAMLRQITDATPTPINELNAAMPTWLSALVSRLHDKQPAKRFQSAGELAELLEQCLAHVQTPSQPIPAELRPSPRWISFARNVALGLAGCIVGGIIWFQVSQSRDSTSTQRNEQVSDRPSVSATSVGKSVSGVDVNPTAGGTDSQPVDDMLSWEDDSEPILQSVRSRLSKLNAAIDLETDSK